MRFNKEQFKRLFNKVVKVMAVVGSITTGYGIYLLFQPIGDTSERDPREYFRQSIYTSMELLHNFCFAIECKDDPTSESKKMCYSGNVKIGPWTPNECYDDFLTRSNLYSQGVSGGIPDQYRKYIEEGERRFMGIFMNDERKKDLYKGLVYKCDPKEPTCYPETRKNSNPYCKYLPDTDNSCQPFYCDEDGQVCKRVNGVNKGFPVCGSALKEHIPTEEELKKQEKERVDRELRYNNPMYVIHTCFGPKEYGK